MLNERIVQDLAQIVGADNVSADTADRILHAFDATQGRFLPEVVVHATTSDQVSRVVRLAHEHLGEITGRFRADDLLGEIFASFCIGK